MFLGGDVMLQWTEERGDAGRGAEVRELPWFLAGPQEVPLFMDPAVNASGAHVVQGAGDCIGAAEVLVGKPAVFCLGGESVPQ